MRKTWGQATLILATLLGVQACGSPEAQAFAIGLASQVAQQLQKEGPAQVPSAGGKPSGGGQGGTSTQGAEVGRSSEGSQGGAAPGGGAGSSSGATGGAQVASRPTPRPTPQPTLAPGLPSGLPSVAEDELLTLLKTYRRGKGLPDIPTSRSLMIVAQAHAADLEAHPPDRSAGCNMHSWSSFGPWKAVCYTSDHAQAQGMWRKPQELGTPYPGNGFEIAFGMSGADPSPQDALDGWISSPGHHAVMINEGSWKDNTWQAVGAGMKGGYAVIWFGEEADPAGAP